MAWVGSDLKDHRGKNLCPSRPKKPARRRRNNRGERICNAQHVLYKEKPGAPRVTQRWGEDPMATVPLTTAQGKSHLNTSPPRNTPLLPLAAGTGRYLIPTAPWTGTVGSSTATRCPEALLSLSPHGMTSHAGGLLPPAPTDTICASKPELQLPLSRFPEIRARALQTQFLPFKQN